MRPVQCILWTLVCALFVSTAPVSAANDDGLQVAYVDFRRCAEESDLGRQEQGRFEELNKRIKDAVEAKEQELTETAKLWNDPDHRDSLSPEAEAELGQKGNRLRMEYEEMRKRSMEMLNQANMQIVQRLSQSVGKAAETVASRDQHSMVINKEACFFVTNALDITETVIAQMNSDLEAELAESKITTEAAEANTSHE